MAPGSGPRAPCSRARPRRSRARSTPSADGGAFVVFSQRLNDGFEAIAVEGARASVIGGSAAAGVVFTRDVMNATRRDPRVVEMEERIEAADEAERRRLRTEQASLLET